MCSFNQLLDVGFVGRDVSLGEKRLGTLKNSEGLSTEDSLLRAHLAFGTTGSSLKGDLGNGPVFNKDHLVSVFLEF